MHLSPSNVLASHLAPDSRRKEEKGSWLHHGYLLRSWATCRGFTGENNPKKCNTSLTTSQQVLDQLLMATKARVIPLGRREIHHNLNLAKWSLSGSTMCLNFGTYSGVLSHLSLTLRSTSLCSTRYLKREKKQVVYSLALDDWSSCGLPMPNTLLSLTDVTLSSMKASLCSVTHLKKSTLLCQFSSTSTHQKGGVQHNV